jgi:hypothetical protein
LPAVAGQDVHRVGEVVRQLLASMEDWLAH